MRKTVHDGILEKARELLASMPEQPIRLNIGIFKTPEMDDDEPIEDDTDPWHLDENRPLP